MYLVDREVGRCHFSLTRHLLVGEALNRLSLAFGLKKQNKKQTKKDKKQASVALFSNLRFYIIK